MSRIPTILVEPDMSADDDGDTYLVHLSITWDGFADIEEANDYCDRVADTIPKVKWPT